MSLTENGNGGNGLIMPVAPMYAGGSGGGSGFGGWGGDSGWWIILLFLFALGGWGNGFGGGNGGGGATIPYIMNTAAESGVQRGFDQASVMSGIGSVQNGVQNLSTQLCSCCCDMQGTVNQGFNSLGTQLCNGFAGVNQGVANGFAQAEIADNARQMANMQTAFANQSAMNQGFNQISSQFAECLRKISNKAKEIFCFTKSETVGTCAA